MGTCFTVVLMSFQVAGLSIPTPKKTRVVVVEGSDLSVPKNRSRAGERLGRGTRIRHEDVQLKRFASPSLPMSTPGFGTLLDLTGRQKTPPSWSTHQWGLVVVVIHRAVQCHSGATVVWCEVCWVYTRNKEFSLLQLIGSRVTRY